MNKKGEVSLIIIVIVGGLLLLGSKFLGEYGNFPNGQSCNNDGWCASNYCEGTWGICCQSSVDYACAGMTYAECESLCTGGTTTTIPQDQCNQHSDCCVHATETHRYVGCNDGSCFIQINAGELAPYYCPRTCNAQEQSCENIISELSNPNQAFDQTVNFECPSSSNVHYCFYNIYCQSNYGGGVRISGTINPGQTSSIDVHTGQSYKFGSCGDEMVVPICGNGVCESGESFSNCPEDCAFTGQCSDLTTETSCKAASCTWWTAYLLEPSCVECVPDGKRIGGSVCGYSWWNQPTCNNVVCDCPSCCSKKVHSEMFAGSMYYFCGNYIQHEIPPDTDCSILDETECPSKKNVCCWESAQSKCWKLSEIPSNYEYFDDIGFCRPLEPGEGGGGDGGGGGGGGDGPISENCTFQTSWIPEWVPFVGSKTIKVVGMCEAEKPCLNRLSWGSLLHPTQIPSQILDALIGFIKTKLGFADPCAMCEKKYVDCKIEYMGCLQKSSIEKEICKLQAWLEGIRINKGDMYYYAIIIGVPLVLLMIFKPNIIRIGGRKR